jgi:hypothetical protein
MAGSSHEKDEGFVSVNREGVLLAIARRKSKVENRFARVAKLADAPDLGLRNHRFQRVAFHFKANAFYVGKTGFSCEIVAAANGE